MPQRKPPRRNRGKKPRPPMRQRANLGGESMFVATCDACGKRGFTSRQEAKRGAARIHPGTTMRFYQCGTLWHMTSVDSGVMAEYREQDVPGSEGEAGRESDPRAR